MLDEYENIIFNIFDFHMHLKVWNIEIFITCKVLYLTWNQDKILKFNTLFLVTYITNEKLQIYILISY